MKKLLLIVVPIVALALIAGVVIARGGRTSDEDQITALIEHGRQAIEKKSSGAALNCISKDYSDSSGIDYKKLKQYAAGMCQMKATYEITVDTPSVRVTGDTAAASTHVSLTAVTNGSKEPVFSGPVVLHLKKEPAKRFLIFPTSEWKVTGMDGIGKATEFNPGV